MKKRRNILGSLEQKYGKYAIPNLMLIIVGAMGIVFIMDYIISAASGISVLSLLTFNRVQILQGEVWRILTFAFLPPNSSIIFIIFSLYFYYMIGSALEREWGSFKFNVFYICGILGAIISGFITGYADNSYLNMTLFLAFAILYPNFEIMLFFFFPIKMKYLGYMDAALLTFLFVVSGWSGKLAILISVLNLLLFFRRDLTDEIQRIWMNIKFRINRK